MNMIGIILKDVTRCYVHGARNKSMQVHGPNNCLGLAQRLNIRLWFEITKCEG